MDIKIIVRHTLYLFASLVFCILSTVTAIAQAEECCARAFKTCGACASDPDPAKRTDNLTYEWCGVRGYYGQLPSSPGASAKLKACQKCIDETCPVGKKTYDPPVDKKKVVQIRPATDSYSWCVNAFSNVFVEKMPAGYDTVGAMAEVDINGTIGDIYSIDERAKLPGRTHIVVPEYDDGLYSDWQVKVIFPGAYADAVMSANSVIRLPCFARDTIKERYNAQVEFSGGVMKWFINAVKMRDYPVDFPELNNFATKEAIGGVKERTQNYYRPQPSNFDLIRAAYDPAENTPPFFEGVSLEIDARTPGTSRFSIVGADLLITPLNTSLRPFTLRSGDQVSVTRTSVGPITQISRGGNQTGLNGTAPVGCGFGKSWNLTNEFGARALWTRIGTSNVFDAVYSYPDGSRFAEKQTVSLNGKTITSRVDYAYGLGNCIHTGTLSADGRSASGTYSCSSAPNKTYKWNAEIFCQ